MGLKIELTYEEADRMVVVALTDSAFRITEEIVDLEIREDKLADYEMEDLKNQWKTRKAMLRVIRYMTIREDYEEIERVLAKHEKKRRKNGEDE